MPDGMVGQAQWSQFLQAVVTPRFPEGFTVWQASGQWRSSDGSIVREPSYVLQLIHAEDEARDKAISEIMSEYKTQFRQEAVLKTRSPVCVSL